ncbi:Methyltransferase domain-containing protein [Colletotrichum higginsianum IMI 349063]|uniref:Methyltransferase domain-containing protein n=1 Tax=Colletotrichum higginsianum (strain IMI 349063) TaxID=759273 RepID=A0A1B7XW05_COLHI|nr:Methyltransferase domain-containing protein [Colletotrichum higginsianum IMI 349063]OBR03946.1 Methyltransferase domain-containing protein [Colletotrichum higginsianum IMI 349063]
MSGARPADGDATTTTTTMTTTTDEPEGPGRLPSRSWPPDAIVGPHPPESFLRFRLSDLGLLDGDLDDDGNTEHEELYRGQHPAGTQDDGGNDSRSDRPSIDATEDGATFNDAASLFSIDDASVAGGRPPSLWSLETSDYENGFQQRHGRTYHPIGAFCGIYMGGGMRWKRWPLADLPGTEEYILPNDTTEQFRLDIQHLLWLATWDGRLCMCPKNESASRVLDVGTGTGVWAMAYADEHPEAIVRNRPNLSLFCDGGAWLTYICVQVTGVDISPIQPQAVAPNCFFEIYNVEGNWPWRTPHDFIFIRHMNTAFADWSETIEKAFRSLEPGGYIELQDNTFPIMSHEGTLPPNSAIAKWSSMLMESTRILGRPCDEPSRFRRLLEDAGFEAVVEIKRVWPIGPWAAGRRHVMTGALCQDTSIAGLEPSTLRLFTTVFGWTVEETKDFCREVEAEIRGQRLHAYFNV